MITKPITFTAEVREVKAKKLITNDIEYRLVLASSDKRMIELATIPSDCVVKVSIEITT